ncbi:MAG: DUF6133 family protein [Actinomycetota bacterium]|nr:DUF6133 family protein [Actinomycetota bacterium]
MMNDQVLSIYVALRASAVATSHRLREERGEGVISAAIAVLIMAFLGALMWVGFKTLFQTTQNKTGNQVNQIGS